MTLYSIITQTQGDLKNLRYTGRSISVQNDAPSFEWIIVGAVPEEFKAEFADLNPVIIETPIEPLNEGLRAATGDYVWFLSEGECLSDTFVLRDVRKEIISALRPDFFYGVAREDGYLKTPHAYHHFKRSMITPFAVMIFLRRTIQDLLFDPRYRYEAPYDFTLRFLEKAKKIGASDRVWVDLQTVFPIDAHVLAAWRERRTIREELLGHTKLRNKIHAFSDRITFHLRKNHPKIYWALRAKLLPPPIKRKPSPVQSKFRLMRRG